MALSRQKYKRVPDLYTSGTELVLRDETVLWMQVMNPLQRDEAQHDAQVARARLTLALKSDHGSNERMKVEAAFFEDGRTAAIDRLVNAKLGQHVLKAVDTVRNDPDWKERLDIMDRSEELRARPPEDAERKLLDEITSDYLGAIQKLQDEEETYLRQHYRDVSDAELIEQYVELYLEHRGTDVAQGEYVLTEIWYSARACEGVRTDDGEWDHSACENHVLQAYETKADIRALPEELQDEMTVCMQQLAISVREAKNSDRQGSSSGSSPLPSEPEVSTASTPAETHKEPRGRSPQLSGTR